MSRLSLSNQLSDLNNLFGWYLRSSFPCRWRFLAVVLCGFTYRVLNILIFAVVIKIFLLIVAPESFLPMLERLLTSTALPVMSASNLVYQPVMVLVVVVLLQFAIGKVHLEFRSRIIRSIQKTVLGSGSGLHTTAIRSIVISRIPIGVESVTRISEILLFYLCIFVVLFWTSPLIALVILAVVTPLICYLVWKRDLFMKGAMDVRQRKLAIGDLSATEFKDLIDRESGLSRESRSGVLIADVLGGLLIAVVLVVVIVGDIGSAVTEFSALMVALGVRFAVVYARECATEISVLLQQRVVYNNLVSTLETSPVSDRSLGDPSKTG